MKLSKRQDIEAPIESVYAAASDFAAIAQMMARRGVAVEPDLGSPASGPGKRWAARAKWRGREHVIQSELVSIDQGQGYAIESVSGGVVCMTVVDLVALSRTRTRLLVSMELRPTTLSARLLVQSLRLAKGRLTRRLKTRMAEFAQRMELGRA
jgi:uncharacterized membrane protein